MPFSRQCFIIKLLFLARFDGVAEMKQDFCFHKNLFSPRFITMSELNAPSRTESNISWNILITHKLAFPNHRFYCFFSFFAEVILFKTHLIVIRRMERRKRPWMVLPYTLLTPHWTRAEKVFITVFLSIKRPNVSTTTECVVGLELTRLSRRRRYNKWVGYSTLNC